MTEKSIQLKNLLIREAKPEDHTRIQEFLAESNFLYPDIDCWWRKRVIPGISEGLRKVLVACSGASIDGIFIGKLGDSAKICTLRLRESARNQGVGRALVTEGLTKLLVTKANRFHVTISEAAEEGAIDFFESLGFGRIGVESDRYRKGVDEFIYACSGQEVEEMVRNELAKGVDKTLFGSIPLQMPHEQTLLMSLKPRFAKPIIEGNKVVEFRRRFSRKYEGATIVFYITSPVKRFLFSARISRVDHQTTENLWKEYHQGGGVSRETFEQYFRGVNNGYAIILSDVTALPRQLELENAKRICPQLRPPQSFQILQPKSRLLQALELPVNL